MEDVVLNGMIGNASGQMGQGLAYVLPETKSDKFYLQQSLENRDNLYKQIAANQQAKQKRSELIDKTLRDKYSNPDNWMPFNNVVRDKWNNWNQEAVALKAKGIDPTTDPGMLKKYDDIKRTATYSNDLKEEYVRLQNAMLNNPDKYDGVEMKRVQEEYNDLMNDPSSWYDNGKRFSVLKGKDPSFSDLLKGMKAAEKIDNDGTWSTKSADIETNKKQVLAKIMADPEKWAGPAMKQFGVDLRVLPYSYGDKIPTDDATIRKMTEGIMNSKNKESFLAKEGIPNDEYAGERLYEQIGNRNRPFDAMINSLSEGLNASVSPEKKRVFDSERVQLAREAGRRADASLSIQNQRLELAKDRAAKSDKKEDSRAAFIQGIQDWKGDALGRFDQALFEIDVNGTKATRKLSPDGKMMVVRVPTKAKDKVGNDVVKWEEYKFTKGVKNAKGKDMINTILNRSENFGSAKSLKVNPYDDNIEENIFGVGELDDL